MSAPSSQLPLHEIALEVLLILNLTCPEDGITRASVQQALAIRQDLQTYIISSLTKGPKT